MVPARAGGLRFAHEIEQRRKALRGQHRAAGVGQDRAEKWRVGPTLEQDRERERREPAGGAGHDTTAGSAQRLKRGHACVHLESHPFV
jgi:hypothetical protein